MDVRDQPGVKVVVRRISNGGVNGLINNPDGCSAQRSRVPAVVLSCRNLPTFVSDFCHHCPLRAQLRNLSQ